MRNILIKFFIKLMIITLDLSALLNRWTIRLCKHDNMVQIGEGAFEGYYQCPDCGAVEMRYTDHE